MKTSRRALSLSAARSMNTARARLIKRRWMRRRTMTA
nr:MAG TPA: hypothetical protein [Caudoviricetes sp.]DAR36036.1 MAG TPA: hypothetical protein [Caudoviricetes sp.]